MHIIPSCYFRYVPSFLKHCHANEHTFIYGPLARLSRFAFEVRYSYTLSLSIRQRMYIGRERLGRTGRLRFWLQNQECLIVGE